jgi:hypothetical protein
LENTTLPGGRGKQGISADVNWGIKYAKEINRKEEILWKKEGKRKLTRKILGS